MINLILEFNISSIINKIRFYSVSNDDAKRRSSLIFDTQKDQ